MTYRSAAAIGVFSAVAIAGCAFGNLIGSPSTTGTSSSLVNGSRIYYRGENARGQRLGYSGGLRFGMGMMGGQLSCASCHGADGRGGLHWMHMQAMDAPDIRWSILASEAHGDHDGEDDHDEPETAYDEALFAQAIAEGIGPSGNRLSREMPRWMISDSDLQDLIEFLKSLE